MMQLERVNALRKTMNERFHEAEDKSGVDAYELARQELFTALDTLAMLVHSEVKRTSKRIQGRRANITHLQSKLLKEMKKNGGRIERYEAHRRTYTALLARGLIVEKWDCPPGYDYGVTWYELTDAGRKAVQ